MSDCARYEPTIDEIMADPTVHALMRADRVNVERLRLKLLQHAAARAPEPAGRRPARLPGAPVSLGARTPLAQAWG